MIRHTRTAVLAALALAALTGCGGTSQADSSNVYEPLPPLSTATPSASPAPQPTSRPAPESPESPTTAPAGEDATDPQSEAVVGGAPAGSSAAGGGAGQASGSGTSGTGVPVSGAVPAFVPAPAPAPVPVPAPAPAPVPGLGGGGAPAQMTERTSSSTTTVTSTTLEARVQLVVSCEGLCVLDDLTAPGLTGGDGPISSTSLQRALQEQLGGQDGDQQRLTDELVEQLTKGDWELADTLVQGGDEKLVFTSARK